MDDGKRDSIERVLRAGGATIPSEDKELTHVLYAGSYKHDSLCESYAPGIVRPADYFSEFLCRNKP